MARWLKVLSSRWVRGEDVKLKTFSLNVGGNVVTFGVDIKLVLGMCLKGLLAKLVRDSCAERVANDVAGRANSISATRTALIKCHSVCV